MKTQKQYRSGSRVLAIVLAGSVAACSGDYSQNPEDAVPVPRDREYYDPNDSVFGEGGLSLSRIASGDIFRGDAATDGSSLPVNKYLWRGALDTLKFLPLASTDPFTGVIATDWGTNPDLPGERFKVTAYMVSASLSASSLKVAVYREVRNEGGVWAPTSVSPETARKLEDAILTRARQLRIADAGGNNTG